MGSATRPLAIVTGASSGIGFELAGVLIAGRALRDEAVSREPDLRFLASMAIWGNALFLLVIALTLFPISLLSPCGV